MFVQCLAKDLDENSRCDRRFKQEKEQGRASKKRKKDSYGGFIVDQAEVDDKIEDDDDIEDDDEIEGREESAREITNDKMDESVLIACDIEEHHRNSNLLELVSNLQRFYTLYYYIYNFGFTFLFSLT